MADTQQIIIEFVSDTSGLKPAEDRLLALGKIDEASAVIFKKTNDQIKERSAAFQSLASDQSKLNVSTSASQDIYNKLVSSLKNLSGESKTAVQQLLKMSAADVAKGFDQAAVGVDDYIKALTGASGATAGAKDHVTALRTELLNLNNQLASLKLSGQDNTAEFAQLAEKAGTLREALQQNRTVITNLSKGTPILTALGAGLQGVTGAFSAAQGASALFGADQKDLQETLVKVNAAMAISQGVQSSLNAIRESAAISTLQLVVAEKLRNAQIAIENGLQSESAIARGVATVAQYALNLAMSLNPIGIVAIALAAFISAIYLYTQASKTAAVEQAALNATIAKSTDILDAGIAGAKRANDEIISDAQLRGARQSELLNQELHVLKQNQKDRLQAIIDLNAAIEKNQNSSDKDIIATVAKAREDLLKLEQDTQDKRVEIEDKGNALVKAKRVESLQDIANVLEGRLALTVKNSDAEFDLEKKSLVAKSNIDIEAAGQDAAKVFEIQSKLAKDIRELNLREAQFKQQSLIAGLEATLSVQQTENRKISTRIGADEIETQLKIIREKTNLEVLQEGLSSTQILAIRKKSLQEQADIQRQFTLKSNAEVIQDLISRNNVELSQVEITDRQKLSLTEDNIIAQASIEIEAAHGLTDAIKAIEAKRDADIRAARIASIQKTLSDEIALNDATNGPLTRNIQLQLETQDKIAAANTEKEKQRIESTTGVKRISLNQQLALIDNLTNIELEDSAKRADALQQEFDDGLISAKEFNIEYAKLQDDQSKIVEDGEKRKRDAVEKTFQLAKAKQQATVDAVFSAAKEGVNILQGIFDNQNNAQQQSLDAQRQHIQDLSNAGAITAKEASARNKKLDAEEKQLQRQQAERDKAIAIFNAVISTAEAVVKALTAGPIAGPILAGVIGALGAAEIAVIASRPIPKFAKGKDSGTYEGPGVVGEAGTELIERDGQMFITTKPTIVWLGKKDTVFNPKETIQMMNGPVMNTTKMDNTSIINHSTTEIDYDMLAKAITKAVPQMGLNIDEEGFKEWVKKGNNFTKYLNNRRGGR